MKKIILIATVAASLSGLSALGQGAFVFGSSASFVWDNFAPTGVPIRDANEKVGFLIRTNGTVNPSMISGIQVAVPTNAATIGQSWNNAQAWNAILNDPNYVLAINNGLSGAGGIVIGTTSTVGGISYNAGGSFFINGTDGGGGTASIIVFGWDATYATPQAAQAAGAALGWTAAFNYAYGAFPTGTPANVGTQAGIGNRFGVFAPVPEPATFTLAGLGTAAMLIFRRRK